jgi:hypothetical protein
MTRRRTSYGGRRSRRRTQRRSQERRFEAITYALILGIFFLAFATPIDDLLVTFLGGLVLVGSGIMQSQRGWRVNIFTWLGGILLLGMGLVSYLQTRALPGGMLFPIGVMLFVTVVSFANGEL